MSTAPLDKPTCARLLEALGLADGGEKAAWALTRVGEVLEAFASDDFWNTPPARAAAMRVEARRIAHAAQKLAEITYSAIASTLGVSLPYAADIRAGRRRPHPRHWQALAELVEITPDKKHLPLHTGSTMQ